jgi:transposase-like protein
MKMLLNSSFNSNLKKKHRYDVRFKLEALAYAEKYSGKKAAKQFGVDSHRIREWKKQKTDLL